MLCGMTWMAFSRWIHFVSSLLSAEPLLCVRCCTQGQDLEMASAFQELINHKQEGESQYHSCMLCSQRDPIPASFCLLLTTRPSSSAWATGPTAAAASGLPCCSRLDRAVSLMSYMSCPMPHASQPPHCSTHFVSLSHCAYTLAGSQAFAIGRQGGNVCRWLNHNHLCHGLWLPQQLPTGAGNTAWEYKELRPQGRTLAGQSRKTGRRQWINSSPFFLPTTTRFSIFFIIIIIIIII